MNFVGIGSLFAANPIASLAVASSTPAISNMMRPGFTTATHFSGAPLPLPMRVSAGFLVNGLSGKIRIHNFPPRLMNRVIATREASICRSVIHAFSMAFSPYSPNAKSPPRHALPLRRPRICFLYFTFFGINIVLFSLSLAASPLRHHGGFAFLLNLRGLLGHVFALIDPADRKSTRLNSSHGSISYAVFCLKKNIQAEKRRDLEWYGTQAGMRNRSLAETSMLPPLNSITPRPANLDIRIGVDCSTAIRPAQP